MMDKPKQSREGKGPSLRRSKQREHYLTLSRELHDQEQEAWRKEKTKSLTHRRGSQLREAEGWRLLRSGETEKALTLLKNLNDETGGRNGRDNLGYGAALMWVGHYEISTKHLRRVIETSKATKNALMLSEDHYALCGAGLWCLGDQDGAMKAWRAGFKAPYAVYGVCLETPRLVLVASILAPELCDGTEALELLKRKASDPRVYGYPGTLSQFLLGKIDIEELESSVEKRAPRNANFSIRDRRFQAAFYRAVSDLARCLITDAEFKKAMASITEPSGLYGLEAQEFWSLTRSPEFYLALHEGR